MKLQVGITAAVIGGLINCAILYTFSSFALTGDEPSLLKTYPKIAKRKEGVLTLSTADGKAVTYKDNLINGENYVQSSLSGIFKTPNQALVVSHFYEGSAHFLISLKTGKELKIPAAPVWSNNQDYFAAANDDESDYTMNAFVIGKCEKDICKIIHEEKVRSGPVKWLSDDTVTTKIPQVDPKNGTVSSEKP